MTATMTEHATAGTSPMSLSLVDETPSVRELVNIAWQALQIEPPDYVRSIFGSPRTWLPPYQRFSEFTMLSPWRPLRTLKFLQNTWLPSIPRTPPALLPPFVEDFFWQPTLIFQRPDHYGNCTSFPDEAWFFINGIMTNDSVAQLNAALLAELFHRPITLIQNSTSSLFTDLLQCALDKQGWRVTEPVTKAMPAIYDALKDPGKARVVLVAHSQGTIIAAGVLRLLKALTVTEPAIAAEVSVAAVPAAAIAGPELIYPEDAPLDLADFAPLRMEELAKLEIYCFATCANAMTQLAGDTGEPIPHIEHFGNANDIVARLGMQAPEPAALGIQIEGARFVRPGAWGHLLNEHYLYPILAAQKQGRMRGGRGTAAPFVAIEMQERVITPRLYEYINGGAPADR